VLASSHNTTDLGASHENAGFGRCVAWRSSISRLPTAQECFVKRLPLLLVTVALLRLATDARAQSDDKAYCAQLVDLYRHYVQNSPGRGFDVDASRALDDCRKGNPEGIPVLEKKLRDNKTTPTGGGEFKP
jgi:hypothetical protein